MSEESRLGREAIETAYALKPIGTHVIRSSMLASGPALCAPISTFATRSYGRLAFTMAVKRDARWSLVSDSAHFQAVS